MALFPRGAVSLLPTDSGPFIFNHTLRSLEPFLPLALPQKTFFTSGYQDSKLIPELNDRAGAVDSGQFAVAARWLARAPSGLLWSSGF